MTRTSPAKAACTECHRADVPTRQDRCYGHVLKQHRKVKSDPNSAYCSGVGKPPSSQWDRYLALADETRLPGTADSAVNRFGHAADYASFVETPQTTDEEWADAFWTAYYSEGE